MTEKTRKTIAEKSKEVAERRFQTLKIIGAKALTVLQIVDELNKLGFECGRFVVESDLGYLTNYLIRERQGKYYTYKSNIGEGFSLEMLKNGIFGKPEKVHNEFISKLFGYTDKVPDPKAGRIFTEKNAVRSPNEHHRKTRHYLSGSTLSNQFTILGI